MINLEFVRELIVIGTFLSTITCTLVQKTKIIFHSSKYLSLYSFVINIIIGLLFSYSFTKIVFPYNLWIGLFSFLGSDTFYKAFEGKLSSYSDLVNNNQQNSVEK
jgi:hypothetical protein